MLDTRRKAYLKAMGIDLWVSNTLAAEALPADSDNVIDSPTVVSNSPSSVEKPAVGESALKQEPVSVPETQAAAPAVSEQDEVSSPAPAFEAVPLDAYEGMPPQEEDDEVDFDFPEPSIPGVAELDWPALAERVSGCQQCGLCDSRTQTVFGVGNQTANLLVVGEAPGADEDRQGEPFVGRAGQLLTAMLAAIGLPREQVYIANVLKCRPPGNRDPHVDEVAACQAYLNRQIALIQPRLILSVGGVSAKNLLHTDESVGRLRGRVHQHPTTETPLMVTYHPAYLLRRPEEKAKAWKDLQQVYALLKEQA